MCSVHDLTGLVSITMSMSHANFAAKSKNNFINLVHTRLIVWAMGILL